MKEMFLYNAFNICKEGAGKVDFSIFVGSLVDVPYFDGDI